MNLREWVGEMDIYLFDQLLKGRFDGLRSVLDVGCGSGRNLVYFLRNGFDVFAIDRDPHAIERVRELAAKLAPALPADNFRVGDIEEMADAGFDAVISCALLHFADDEAHFDRMLNAMWRVLNPGGLFFVRLASSIGLENRVRKISGRRFTLPDGSERFLVDEPMLLDLTERLGGTLLDPLKTTIVQDMRCMTTWCLRKSA
ncbi:MAG: class I SAM-dependent methyltransferase [Candidatus Krumholzibacteria bacterium]